MGECPLPVAQFAQQAAALLGEGQKLIRLRAGDLSALCFVLEMGLQIVPTHFFEPLDEVRARNFATPLTVLALIALLHPSRENGVISARLGWVDRGNKFLQINPFALLLGHLTAVDQQMDALVKQSTAAGRDMAQFVMHPNHHGQEQRRTGHFLNVFR